MSVQIRANLCTYRIKTGNKNETELAAVLQVIRCFSQAFAFFKVIGNNFYNGLDISFQANRTQTSVSLYIEKQL